MHRCTQFSLLLAVIILGSTALAEANLTLVSGTSQTADTVAVGAPFTYNVDIINNGSTAAGRFGVRFRLSLNKVYEQDTDTLIGNFDVAAGLAAGATLSINFQSACPNVAAGVYLIVWSIDYLDEVSESNESDNTVVLVDPVIVFTTTPGTTPVIVSAPLATPALAFPGQPIAFSVSATGDASDVLRYTWLFGDGDQSNDADPFHAYLDQGSYRVRVLVSDGTYGATSELTVTVGGTPSELEASEFFQQRLELDADAVIVALTEAGITVIEGSNPDVDQELAEAHVLADTLVAASIDAKVLAIYNTKAKQIEKAATTLLESIKSVQLANDTVGTPRLKAQQLILNTIKLAVKTNKTLFKARPKIIPGSGGGSSCPGFIIEEKSSKAAGFYYAGDVVTFRISTVGNAPWPADAEVRIIDNVRFSGKNSNNDDGFRLKPPPKSLTLTMGPDAGSSRVEVRCSGKMPKSRLLYNKGPRPVKTPTGGGGGTGGSAPFDGTYSGSGQSKSPLGTGTSTGNFTVTNGHFSDAQGLFTGDVDASGNFQGTWYYSQGSLPIPMSGVFSTTSSFTLSGSIGSTVTGTFTLQKN